MIKILLSYIVKGYNLLISGGNLLQPLVLLAFRIAWGLEYFIDGRGKLTGHADIVSFFKDLGIPFPDLNAWFVGGLECGGGILLILGLLSRPIGLLLLVNMTVAYLSVADDRALVFNMFNGEKAFDAFTAADPFFYWLTALIVLAFGSGPISVDNLLAKTVFKRKARDFVPPAAPAEAAE